MWSGGTLLAIFPPSADDFKVAGILSAVHKHAHTPTNKPTGDPV